MMSHINHGYILYEGESLRDLQKMVHGVRPTTSHEVQPKTPVRGYTSAGLVRRFFGFSR